MMKTFGGSLFICTSSAVNPGLRTSTEKFNIKGVTHNRYQCESGWSATLDELSDFWLFI